VLEKYDDRNFGYLSVTVSKYLSRIGFYRTENVSLRRSGFDLATIDLATHTLVADPVGVRQTMTMVSGCLSSFQATSSSRPQRGYGGASA
jgi:hypothetical protein